MRWGPSYTTTPFNSTTTNEYRLPEEQAHAREKLSHLPPVSKAGMHAVAEVRQLPDQAPGDDNKQPVRTYLLKGKSSSSLALRYSKIRLTSPATNILFTNLPPATR